MRGASRAAAFVAMLLAMGDSSSTERVKRRLQGSSNDLPDVPVFSSPRRSNRVRPFRYGGPRSKRSIRLRGLSRSRRRTAKRRNRCRA